MLTDGLLMTAYDRLLEAYGPQGWWPGESPLEVVVGAVLVQNTAWPNVERAIANLRDARLLDLRAMHELPEAELQQHLRPAGFFRVKAKRLRNLLGVLVEEYEGSLDRLFALPTDELRSVLLSVSGVGPETADSILLYAAGRPVFVVGAYTRRVLERHGWHEGDLSYSAMQRLFESRLPAEPALFNEYHALLVEVGKRHCRPAPRCEGCPLEPMLPPSGVVGR